MLDSFLMLGGNLGDSFACLTEAVQRIASLSGVFSPLTSRVFLTEPVSHLPQPKFLNAAVHLKTTLEPKQLFFYLEEIEKALGKKKKEKFEPRVIDIDLIFYGNHTVEEEGLIVPHPRWQERLFVMYPLADLVGLRLPPHPSVVPYPKKLPFQVRDA